MTETLLFLALCASLGFAFYQVARGANVILKIEALDDLTQDSKR